MIKKVLVSLLIAAPVFLSSAVWATPQQELSTRLGKVNSFSADFTQKVISPEGDLLVEGGRGCGDSAPESLSLEYCYAR